MLTPMLSNTTDEHQKYSSESEERLAPSVVQPIGTP
jgi:hypothetical protein